MCLTLHRPCPCVVVKPYLIFQTCFKYPPKVPPSLANTSTPLKSSCTYICQSFSGAAPDGQLGLSAWTVAVLAVVLSRFKLPKHEETMAEDQEVSFNPDAESAFHRKRFTNMWGLAGKPSVNLPLFNSANCVTITPPANDRVYLILQH